VAWLWTNCMKQILSELYCCSASPCFLWNLKDYFILQSQEKFIPESYYTSFLFCLNTFFSILFWNILSVFFPCVMSISYQTFIGVRMFQIEVVKEVNYKEWRLLGCYTMWLF
jgi:hypothetical protein